ncbi:Meiotic central spindle [Carabus blaptoides fortunei]
MNMYRTDSNKVKLLDMLTYLSFETSCIEEDIPMYICDDCYKHLQVAYDLKVKCQKNNIYHYKTEHQSSKLCTKCKLIFNTDSEYNKHMKRHDSKWTCTVCNKSVGQKTFRAHMKSHERSKCSLCDKYFDMKQLNEHNCMEQWEKTYKCTECDRTFYFQPSLVKHMMVHYEMQCFICKVTFGKPHAIVEHMSKHIGQNGYHCPICNFCTFSKDNMKLHMTEHNGQINNTTAQINTKYL